MRHKKREAIDLPMKSFFFSTFCILSTLHAEPPNTENFTYVLFDNQTVATEEDLLQDPLLILRSPKRFSKDDSIVEGYQQVAKLHYFTSKQPFLYQPLNSLRIPSYDPRLIALDFSENSSSTHSIKVTNLNSDFVYSKPYFNLEDLNHNDQMWWQISSTLDFSSVFSTFEKICPFNRSMTLTELEETFLNNETVYYFRVKGENFGVWGPWSQPFAFTIVKPNPVENFHMDYRDNHQAKLCWESDDPDNSYLVFGSNSIDFIPQSIP